MLLVENEKFLPIIASMIDGGYREGERLAGRKIGREEGRCLSSQEIDDYRTIYDR